MVGRGPAAIVFLSLGLAGCSGSPKTLGVGPTDGLPSDSGLEPANSTDNLSALQRALGALPVGEFVTVDDWYLFTGVMDPRSGLTGYNWTVPLDAVLAGPDGAPPCVVFEHAGLLPEGDVSRFGGWGLFLFELREGQATYREVLGRGPWHWREQWLDWSLEEDETPAFWLRPGYARVCGDDLKAGQEFKLVLVATGAASSEFGLALRTLRQRPADGQVPAKDWADFAKNLTVAQPLAPARLGQGVGSYSEVYVDVNVYGYEYEGWTPDAKPVDTAPPKGRPFAVTRDMRVSVAYEAPWAWTLASGYVAGHEAVGTWEAGVQAAGSTRSYAGRITPSGPGWELDLASGEEWYLFHAEGAAKAASSMHVTVGDTGLLNVIAFVQYSLGAPLKDLIGSPARPMDDSAHGPVPAPELAQRVLARAPGAGLSYE